MTGFFRFQNCCIASFFMLVTLADITFKTMCYFPRSVLSSVRISVDLPHFFTLCSIWHVGQQNGRTRERHSKTESRWNRTNGLKNVAINKCSNQEQKKPNTRNERDAFYDAHHFTYLSTIIIEMLSTLVSIYFGCFSNWNFTCSSISIGFYFVTILLSVYIVPFGLVCNA